MGDEPQQQKQRKSPWKKPYSSTRLDVEQRIGTTLRHLHSTAISVEEILDKEGIETIKATKDEVYKGLARCRRVEAHDILMETNVNDLAVFIIIPIIDEFMQRAGRDTLQLFREKQLIPEDEEFVVIDRIEITEERYILIIEAKRESLGTAMDQCLLAMKEQGDSNYLVYGFVTTGGSWRMLRYDGASFLITDKIEAYLIQWVETRRDG
ncbi:hypothetical protein EV426DRAFT_721537 [Tirmania nivea]|nr:hypothetical protein EV426DRAFT_721537 [Tirmania nivea]